MLTTLALVSFFLLLSSFLRAGLPFSCGFCFSSCFHPCTFFLFVDHATIRCSGAGTFASCFRHLHYLVVDDNDSPFSIFTLSMLAGF